jgi:hypothetical protein
VSFPASRDLWVSANGVIVLDPPDLLFTGIRRYLLENSRFHNLPRSTAKSRELWC